MDAVLRGDLAQQGEQLVLTEGLARQTFEDERRFGQDRSGDHGRGQILEAFETDRLEHFVDLPRSGTQMAASEDVARPLGKAVGMALGLALEIELIGSGQAAASMDVRDGNSRRRSRPGWGARSRRFGAESEQTVSTRARSEGLSKGRIERLSKGRSELLSKGQSERLVDLLEHETGFGFIAEHADPDAQLGRGWTASE